ncbi:MAG TPA: hypothetical protein VEX68_01305 [Bryobacteraceae bacterium]|nr:hypothetical protein [Bryobacteraceae bacterium]
MSSARKIAANRANAQRSTGPQTIEGKQQTRYNATRHGLSGKRVVVDGEDPKRYEALLRDLIDAYQPANAAELTLVEDIAQNFWRLQRARAIEAETFNMWGSEPVTAMNNEPLQFERIQRYMTTIERAYHRAIDQLQETQKLRAKQEASRPATELGSVSQSLETKHSLKSVAVGQTSVCAHEPVELTGNSYNHTEAGALSSLTRDYPVSVLYQNVA